MRQFIQQTAPEYMAVLPLSTRWWCLFISKITLSIFLTAVSGIALSATDMTAVGLDPSFGKGGIVTAGIGDKRSGATAVAVQLDGKVVAAGFSSDYNYNDKFAIARFNSDGTLDQSFGIKGITITSVGVNSSASAIAIQSDGKIVVAGFSVVDKATSGFTLVRYNPDGKLDQAFGKNGLVTPSIGSRTGRASAVAIQNDGKIIVGGTVFVRGFEDFAIARYNPDGTIDLTFGNGGLVTTDINKLRDFIAAIAIQPDGKIIAVGTGKEDVTNHFALARYNSNGELDPTFGIDGIVTKSIGKGNSFAHAIVLQPDGKIVAIGDSSTDPNERYQYTPVISLVRFNSDGIIDPLFGKDGVVTTTIGKSTSSASTAASQSDGKIIVVGTSVKTRNESGYFHSFLVARYQSDGAIDMTFGTGGFVTTEIGAGTDVAYAVAIQADGKIIAAGNSRNNANSEFALIRYVP